MNIDNEKKAESDSMKWLGVIYDGKLNFDGEVKKILQRMASGLKVLTTLSTSSQEKTEILLPFAIVISHLQYSALFLLGLQNSILTIWNNN